MEPSAIAVIAAKSSDGDRLLVLTNASEFVRLSKLKGMTIRTLAISLLTISDDIV